MCGSRGQSGKQAAGQARELSYVNGLRSTTLEASVCYIPCHRMHMHTCTLRRVETPRCLEPCLRTVQIPIHTYNTHRYNTYIMQSYRRVAGVAHPGRHVANRHTHVIQKLHARLQMQSQSGCV